MPIQIDQVTTEVRPVETRSDGSSQPAQSSASAAPAQRELEKRLRLLAERLLRLTAH